MVDILGYAGAVIDSVARDQLAGRIRRSSDADRLALATSRTATDASGSFPAFAMKQRIGGITAYLRDAELALNAIREALASSKEIGQVLMTARTVARTALSLGPDAEAAGLPASTGLSGSDRAADIAGYGSFEEDAPASAVGSVDIVSRADLLAGRGIGNLETLTVDTGGRTYRIVFGQLARQVGTPDELVRSLNAIAGIEAELTDDGALAISAADARSPFTLGGTADIEAAFGLAAQTYEPTNLLGQGIGPGDTLTFRVGSGALQTITFGAGSGEVSTLAELRSELGALGGIAAALDGANRLVVRATSNIDTVTVGGTADVAGRFGLARRHYGPTGEIGTIEAGATRSSLQAEYNALILKIDGLVTRANYRGVNLLSGGSYTIASPDNPENAQRVDGPSLGAAALGLAAIGIDGFASDGVIEDATAALDAALDAVQSAIGTLERERAVVTTRSNSYRILSNMIGASLSRLELAELDHQDARRVAVETKSQLAKMVVRARLGPDDLFGATGLDGGGREGEKLPALIGQPDLARMLLSSIGETDLPDASRTIATV